MLKGMIIQIRLYLKERFSLKVYTYSKRFQRWYYLDNAKEKLNVAIKNVDSKELKEALIVIEELERQAREEL